MQFPTKTSDLVSVVQVSGTLDALAGTHLTVYLEDQIKRGNKRIVLDMARLDFMSSAGIRTVLTSTRTARASGGDLALATVPDLILRVLDLGGVLALVQQYPDVASASAAIRR